MWLLLAFGWTRSFQTQDRTPGSPADIQISWENFTGTPLELDERLVAVRLT
jgi:hypothetical protein